MKRVDLCDWGGQRCELWLKVFSRSSRVCRKKKLSSSTNIKFQWDAMAHSRLWHHRKHTSSQSHLLILVQDLYFFYLHPSAHRDKSKKHCFLQIGLGVPELCLATISLIFLKMLKISATIEAGGSLRLRGSEMWIVAQSVQQVKQSLQEKKAKLQNQH